MAAASLCFGSITPSLDCCRSSKPVSSSLSPSLSARPVFLVACHTEEKSSSSKRRVSIFWDLDNKPPKASPYHVALHLRRVAAQFGNIADMVACANRHAFLHIPRWVQEQRGFTHPNSNEENTERTFTDPISDSIRETQGLFASCMCAICGIRCATHTELKKHARLSHKRVWRSMGFKTHDSGGYGLHMELVRAGFWVRMVDETPQAADRALKRQMKHSMNNNVHCICLVSDDSDFTDILKMARSKEIFIVVVGDSESLHQYSDTWFSWTGVAHGQDNTACTWQDMGNAIFAHENSIDTDLTMSKFLRASSAIEGQECVALASQMVDEKGRR